VNLRQRDAVTARRLPGGDPLSFRIAARPTRATESYEWVFTPERGSELRQGDTVIFEFDTTQIGLAPPNEPRSEGPKTVAELIESEGISFLGFDGGETIYVYYRVQLPVAGGPQTPPDIDEIVRQVIQVMPSLPLVTISTEFVPANGDSGTGFEIWFHLDVEPREDVWQIQEQPKFRLFAEVEPRGNVTSPLEITSFELRDVRKRNVFFFFLGNNDHKREGASSPYLRFVFPTADNVVTNARGETMSLADYIQKVPVKFTGHNAGSTGPGGPGGEDSIVAYVRVPEQGRFG
jgi:hypothetical protein